MHEYPFETYKVILKEAKHCSSFNFKREDRGGKTNVGFVLMDSLLKLLWGCYRVLHYTLTLESEPVIWKNNGKISM